MSLEWWCENCGVAEPVEPTGDPENEYEIGDSEPCLECYAPSVVRAVQCMSVDSTRKDTGK